MRQPDVLFVGSYPPRECGIATFTEDIRAAYDGLDSARSDVIAINDPGKSYRYAPFVCGEICRDDRQSYLKAARLANEHPAHVINIQHEYGLFGGDRGDYLLDFLGELRKPVILTMHTTLPNPDARMRFVTRELCNRSDAVIVLAYAGRRILEERYGIDSRKVEVVLHGVPDVPLRRSHHFKRRLGLENKTVLATFGLLSRGKGIEYVIEALPEIFRRHPDAHYLLLGETHPEVRKHEGESYRQSLLDRVDELGLRERVTFQDHYMQDDEVVGYLEATDIYLSPSLDPDQIVSGTLSYAVACGRVVIATESIYAKELLADGRGITVPFRDARSLSSAVNAVLGDAHARASLETAAYRYGRSMSWPKVARAYEDVFCDAMLRRETARAHQLSTLESAASKLWGEALQRQTSSLAASLSETSSSK
ncbi:MAG: glycosyltransferase family 4 protein [Candidatus Eremiobacteraeota bacterium]|nr:glycosyltransferase family 4 protein [Candidatus Eremiobacteraeota bacterium]